MEDASIPRRLYLSSLVGLLATTGCLGEGGGNESGPETSNGPQGTEAVVPATTVTSLATPVRGDPDADVTVATYEDFACPHCRDYSLDVQPEVVEAFVDPGDVRYERYDFPIPVDEQWSWAAANAARAVQADAGADAFWEYADLLYENQDGYSSDLFPDLAEQVDADSEAVRTAVRDGVYRPVIEEDRRRGRQRGVTGTPTVFVDGRSVDPTFEEIRTAVEDALDSSG